MKHRVLKVYKQDTPVYIDLSTSNKSFLDVSTTLKKEGIKHWYLPLMTYDPNIIGLDPWKPDLSLIETSRIVTECVRNFWYFIREVFKVKVPGGLIPYQLHRGNLAESFCILNNVNQILMLPRQHYKTQSAAICYLWQILYKSKNYQYLFAHKALSGAQDNLKRVKDAMEGIPDYLLSSVNKRSDIFNVESMLIRSNNNQIKLLAAPSNPNAADKQGRGATSPIVWLDEFAFLKYNRIIFNALVPANSTASELARKNKTPYGILITTTPSNLDEDQGAYCKLLIDNAWKFDEHIYDWYWENGEEYIHQYINDPIHSENNFVYIEFSYKQLGKDDAWLEEQKRLMNNDMNNVKRELLLQWTLGSNTTPFSEEQLDKLTDNLITEPFGSISLLDDRYHVTVLKQLKNSFNKNYIIGVDVAGGLGRDSSAITIIDPSSQEPMAVFKNNRIAVTELADLLVELITTYIPNAVLIPERNNAGITLIQMLEKTEIDKNLYYSVKTAAGIHTITQERPNINDISGYTKKKSTRIIKGLDTTAKVRDIMINEILFGIVNQRPELINNTSIMDEIKTLQRKRTGKIEHADGKHDDQLFSYLIGLYPLLFDNNIGKFIKVVGDLDDTTNMDSVTKRTRNSMINVIKMNRESSGSMSDKLVAGFKKKYTLDEEEHMLRQQALSKTAKKANKIDNFRNFLNNLNN